MANTNKIILIDHNTNKVHCFSSKGSLADYLHISRDNIINWFRHSNVAHQNNCTIMTVDYYHTKIHPPRPDRKKFF